VSLRQIRKRLQALQQNASCTDHGEWTLEECCRHLWLEDRSKYRNNAAGNMPLLKHFMPTFEQEDADRAALQRRAAR